MKTKPRDSVVSWKDNGRKSNDSRRSPWLQIWVQACHHDLSLLQGAATRCWPFDFCYCYIVAICDCLQCQHFFSAFNMYLIVFTFRRAFEVVFRGLMSSIQNPPCFPPRDHPQAGHFNPTLQYRCVNGAVALFCWNQAAEEILLGLTTMNWEILYLVHTCI